MPYPELLSGQEITPELLAAIMPLEARKLADEQRTNATLAADAVLSVPVAAQAAYRVTSYIIYSQNLAASATSGITIGWTAPAGATLQWTSGGTSGTTATTTQDVTVQNLAATRGLPSNLGTRMSAIPFGTLVTGVTAGTFSLRWAQVAVNAIPTFVHADSWISLRRVA
ncbi:hypothetical protein [Streptomyces sp. NPDC093111]|uniref:hypothetical protein n=1 Tax=Streptomyces sp. NPDC093111 TaxID=3154978 RepID=UPI0034489E18